MIDMAQSHLSISENIDNAAGDKVYWRHFHVPFHMRSAARQDAALNEEESQVLRIPRTSLTVSTHVSCQNKHVTQSHHKLSVYFLYKFMIISN